MYLLFGLWSYMPFWPLKRRKCIFFLSLKTCNYTHSLFFLLMYKKYLRGRHVTNSCMKPSLYNMKRFLITGFLLLIFAAFLSFNGKTLHLELSLSFFVKYTYTYALSFSLCKKYLRGRHVTTN